MLDVGLKQERHESLEFDSDFPEMLAETMATDPTQTSSQQLLGLLSLPKHS